MTVFLCSALCVGFALASCGPKPDTGEDPQVTAMGVFEVTARLQEIPGEFSDDPLYDYVYILKYEVLQVHRGELDTDTLYIGHYKPLRPRAGVADIRTSEIGGNLEKFRLGDTHRMALEVPIDDYFLGGIMNLYSEIDTGPLYWAVWTNRVIQP